MTPTHPKALPEQEPGGRSLILTTPNPRRRQASPREVKVLHDGRKRQRLSLSPEKESQQQKSQEIADEAPWVLTSQASGSSDQSGSKWFNAASKNIDPGQRHPELDDDPPFYLSNHSNYIPANFIASENGRPFGGQSRIDSENEDLRGVIDDLTVENKRLKHIIRRQQRQSRSTTSEASQQQQDKLFEVRMHSLPPEKRRELEYLLKTFASSVHTTDPSKRGSASNGSASITSSGQNDNSKDILKTDSGYASNTTASAGNWHPATAGVVASKSPTAKAVRSYLQDIPDALLPKRNPIMSERAKQALVVRRLEQLFTGRKAAPGEHNHPMQQQEISQSAAKADRAQDARDNRKRRAEGTREAHVMPPDTKINLDAMDSPEMKGRSIEKPQGDGPTVDTMNTSRSGSPDQRPTRPLDLDFHRAQAAAENFQYIRHLGLSCPQPSGTLKDGEESPWIFLNLLASLAQLHTLNVTAKFIRRAIKKLSKRLELSKDGHKVRWVGGNEGTKFSAGDEKAVEVANISPQESTEEARPVGSSKHSKTNSTSNAARTSNTPSDEQTSGLQTSSDSKQPQMTTSRTSGPNATSIPTKATTQSSAFDYKPIVLREKPRTEYEEFRDSEESLDSLSGDSSGLVHALSRSNLKQQSKGEGPITFYNNPYFCSDFSSEQESTNMLPPRPIVVGETLGIAIPAATCESPLRHHDATYFTMQFAPKPFDPEVLSEEGKARFESSLPKLPPLSPMDKAGEEETVPMEMEICGLGGVTPADNFALDVKYEVKPVPSGADGMVARQLPFSRRKYRQKYASKIISRHKVDLLPSKLPPPSYIFFTSSSSSDTAASDDLSESSGSSSSPFVDEEYPAPPAFLRQFSSSSAENMGDDEDDDKDSSEIDMLAIARQMNPEQITGQERVYMINRPGYLHRAAAGSLAATVGASRSNSSRHGVAGASSISNVSMESQNDEEEEDDEDEEMGEE